MNINFTKMHGLGNDFIVIDNTQGNISLSERQIQGLAERNFGIGFDQLLMIESSTVADFRYIIYNADGVQVEQCGNGARCVALFVQRKKLSNNNPLTAETKSGLLSLLINADRTVRVDMGKPIWTPDKIPLLVAQQQLYYQIEGEKMGVVSLGNPHCVLPVKKEENIANVDIVKIATAIQNSALLPNSANIGFMQIINKNEINLRVYERGVGETLACGSGACAAAVFGVVTGQLNNNISAHLNGGDVSIEYHQNASVFLCGDAEFVFDGKIEV